MTQTNATTGTIRRLLRVPPWLAPPAAEESDNAKPKLEQMDKKFGMMKIDDANGKMETVREEAPNDD